MTRINYPFHTPIPKFFKDCGYLNPMMGRIHQKRLAFLTWAFSKCRSYQQTQYLNCKEITIDPFELTFTRSSGVLESGLTAQEFRTQLRYHLNKGFIVKTKSQFASRFSAYKWQVNLFEQRQKMEVNQPTILTNQPMKVTNQPMKIINQNIANQPTKPIELTNRPNQRNLEITEGKPVLTYHNQPAINQANRISNQPPKQAEITREKINQPRPPSNQPTNQLTKQLTNPTNKLNSDNQYVMSKDQPATNQPRPKLTNQLTKQNSALTTENQTVSRVNQPTTNQPPNHFYKTVDSSLLISGNNDNSTKKVEPPLSLGFSNKPIAFFNPRSYRLKNGSHLSLRTQNAFSKYRGKELERLVANVKFYEEYCDEGKIIKSTHEQFLQYCINNDLAKKKENAMHNDLYVRWKKEELKIKFIEIKKTVVIFHNQGNEEPFSISKELPPNTFSDVLENYLNRQENSYETRTQ